MKSLTELYNVSIKSKAVKRESSTPITFKEYFTVNVLTQLLNTVKKQRGVSVFRQNSPLRQVDYEELVTKQFIPNKNYMLVLNACPFLLKVSKTKTPKKIYELYLWAIKRSLRGKPYKKTKYQVYPEFGDINGKFHANLLINLDSYTYVKDLVHEIRSRISYGGREFRYSCTLPTTYGRKPNFYACKDAYYMQNLGYPPYIK